MIDELINSALQIIEDAIDGRNNPCVAFSGGKDSTTVLSLARKVDKNIKGVFCNTGVEWPQTWKYCRSMDNMIELHPKKGVYFFKIVKEGEWPGQKGKGKNRVNKCCEDLKDRPMKKYVKENDIDLILTGLTMHESNQRKIWLISEKEGYGKKGKVTWVKSWNTYKAHPIWNWKEEDVWEYINSNKIDYNPIYDAPINAERCGCMPCTAYRPWKRNLCHENPLLLKIMLKLQNQSQLEDKWECSGGS